MSKKTNDTTANSQEQTTATVDTTTQVTPELTELRATGEVTLTGGTRRELSDKVIQLLDGLAEGGAAVSRYRRIKGTRYECKITLIKQEENGND